MPETTLHPKWVRTQCGTGAKNLMEGSVRVVTHHNRSDPDARFPTLLPQTSPDNFQPVAAPPRSTASVQLAARDLQPEALGGEADMLALDDDQLGLAQRAGIAEQQQGAVAQVGPTPWASSRRQRRPARE